MKRHYCKLTKKEYDKQRYQKNKDRIKERIKKYQEKNKAEINRKRRERFQRQKNKCECENLKSNLSKLCRNCYLYKYNPMWKGDDVKFNALHTWIKRRKSKPELCKCKERPPYDLANISGEYKRDLNDFEWLCRKCHMKGDGRMNNLKQFK